MSRTLGTETGAAGGLPTFVAANLLLVMGHFARKLTLRAPQLVEFLDLHGEVNFRGADGGFV